MSVRERVRSDDERRRERASASAGRSRHGSGLRRVIRHYGWIVAGAEGVRETESARGDRDQRKRVRERETVAGGAEYEKREECTT